MGEVDAWIVSHTFGIRCILFSLSLSLSGSYKMLLAYLVALQKRNVSMDLEVG